MRLQVVRGRAADLHVTRRGAPLLRDVDDAGSRQELAGQRLRHGLDVGRLALRDDLAAVLAGARPDVDDVVGGAHRLLVVLDDDDRVAELAQPLERRDELGVVALVQADRRLVEDVEHADERRPDLGRQPDALRLATAQRRRRALHRQVADADVLQEVQPLLDLAQDEPRDVALGVCQLHLGQPRQRRADAQVRELVDRHPRHEHRARLGPQPGAAARRARPHAHVLLDLLARELGVGLAVASLEVGDDPLEARLVGAPAAVAVAIGDLHGLAVRAVEEQLAVLLLQLLPRRLEVDAVALGDRLADLLVVVRGAVGPRGERALGDRQRRVGHDQLGVDLALRAQAGAALAGAVRGVEGEHPRLELGHRGAALQAGEALGERQHRSRAVLPSRRQQLDLDDRVRQPRRRLDRVGQALADVVAHDEPVDDHRDVVLELLVELDRIFQQAQLAVDLRPRVAVGAQLVEELAVLALAPAHDRREHHEARALLELHDLIDDLLDRLALDRRAADVAVRLADPRPQQAQVVVDLGDCADRRTRVARRRLLVDRDRRREALDRVDVGLVHLPEELARVGAQRLDVAALALGVDRVERQRGLARARQSGDDDKRVTRQLEADVLEIVLAGAADDDAIVLGHSPIVGGRTDVRIRSR